MTAITEGNLEFTFNGALNVCKFDASGKTGHGLSHCMKAVDFIVEFPGFYLFIEVKDPEGAPSGQGRTGFIADFTSGKIDSELCYKYRDSFLYEWASGRANKPIYYYVLFAWTPLSKAELGIRAQALKRNLPLNGPQMQAWARPFVHDCVVFNISSWNQHFPNYPVVRFYPPPLRHAVQSRQRMNTKEATRC